MLSPVTDDFFREHMFTDYGAMNDAVHGKLEELKQTNPHLGREVSQAGGQAAGGGTGSIQDMQRLVKGWGVGGWGLGARFWVWRRMDRGQAGVG